MTSPLVPTTAAELHASTAAEFAALLRKIQVRSGLSVPEVARRAGLPRSQAYSMLTRGTLPTKPAQVRLFVTTCGLPEPLVAVVMGLWVSQCTRKPPPGERGLSPAAIRRRSSRVRPQEPREASAWAGTS